jgi:DNA-binding NarL/FixJ family response regulator
LKTQVLTASPGTWTGPVLICDDRPLFGESLRAQLGAVGDHFEVVRVVRDASALLAALDGSAAARTTSPQVVFIGVHGASRTGLDAIGLVRSFHPATSVLAFGAPGDAEALAEAVSAGANGVLLWDLSLLPLHGTSTAGILRPPSRIAGGPSKHPLTDREERVLQEISKGRSNGEISRELLLSMDSVKNTAHRMFSKLGARDRAHAVAIALRDGLLS